MSYQEEKGVLKKLQGRGMRRVGKFTAVVYSGEDP